MSTNTTTKLSAESFLGLVKQSTLLDPDTLKKMWKEIKDAGINPEDGQSVASEFVARNVLTKWQADKLLQGKHKGFFLGKYRLLSHLGSGGMSSVYLAEHTLMRRRVAVKVLPSARVNDSSYLQRFHREAQAVAALDHRNIVRAYDVDQEGQVHFLVMEYVAGTSLHDLVTKNGTLDFVSAVEYTRQAAEGLQHAHRAGMVHRDIKPGNLLLDEKGTIKLLDLGLARFFDDKDENSLTIKHDEKVLGTADYLSPEQALDSHSVDIRSDIYSLGCTLYYLLTGHPPFPEGTLAQRLLAHQTKPPKPIKEIRTDIPASLVAVLDKMMAKKVDERYQTAKDTAQALLQWLAENGGSAWSKMNPMVGGSSSMIGTGGQSVATPSQSSVLSGGKPVLAGTSAAGIATSVAAAGTPEVQGGAPQPELAAFLTNMATSDSGPLKKGKGRGSSAIKRDAPDTIPVMPVFPSNDAPALEATLLTEAAPADSPFAPTISSPGFTDPDRTVAASSVHVEAQFQPTVMFSQEEEIAAPAVAVPVAKAISVPVATPVGTAPVAKPVAAQPAVAVPVAKPVQTSPASASKNAKLLIIGLSSAVVLLIGIVGFVVFGRGGGDSKPKGSGKKVKPGTQVTESGDSKKNSGKKTAPARHEISVGATGSFSSISAALAEARNYVNNRSKRAVFTIKVAGGQTYSERIVLDETYIRGIQFVVEGGQPAILAPTGPEPVVVIRGGKGVENFGLEGFHLDGSGKEYAIQLSDWVQSAHLKNLQITGCTKGGILFDGTQTYGAENDRNVVENVTFRSLAPEAAGIVLRKKDEDPRYVRVEKCKFFAPMSVGVLVPSGVIGLEVAESIFHQTTTGVRFDGENRAWKDVVLTANTFFENDRAIVFSNMPGSGSGDLGFYNNLFFNSKTSDCQVEKDYKVGDFLNLYRTAPGGSLYNWTTRPKLDSPPPNEVVYLFETTTGKFGATDVQFVSTDPANPDFLAPAASSPHRSVGTIDAKRFGAQVGAVRAK